VCACTRRKEDARLGISMIDSRFHQKVALPDLTFSYWQMREVTDIALQRLYWACRTKSDFPGEIPDESTGTVTTEAILKGLGLIEATPDGSGLSPKASPSTRPLDKNQIITPPAEAELTREDPLSSAESSSTVPPLANQEFDMRDQFRHFSTPDVLCSRSSSVKKTESDAGSRWHEDPEESFLDVEDLLDISPCVIPTDPLSSDNFDFNKYSSWYPQGAWTNWQSPRKEPTGGGRMRESLA